MSEEIYDVQNLPATRDEESQLPDAKKMLAFALERSKYQEAITKLALNSTEPSDWVNYGGKPGISGPGSERIRMVFGLRAFNINRKKTTNEDGSYVWETSGQIGMNENETIDVIGTCASTKPFFAKKEGNTIPASEVDESNIKKNADTNFYVNGISRFLGLRGLTWERLTKLTEGKIVKDKAQNIDYGSQTTDRSDEETGQTKVIWRWIMEMNGNSVEKAKTALQNFTKFPVKGGKDFPGYTDVNKVSVKVLPGLYKKVEKAIDSWGANSTEKTKSTKKQEEKPKNNSHDDKTPETGVPWDNK